MDATTLPVIMLLFDVYKQVTTISVKLPKRWNYGLGISIEKSVLECLEYLVMAKNAPKQLKSAYLIKASAHLEMIRFKLRLILENKLANETIIFQTQANIAEAGRMLGGWLKSTQST
ncbi:hypothetical protein A3D80_03925 [Candidatus Roizmanbacteria bacterium RIFCSPHIGHO2_02_FULL_40_13b]|uniref:bAvd-like domain-containing protein n=1 Tax=Candidatus Roizmanbacteria bacterium RIFCSPHIGHO2_01_FULL_39_24 TaxID=1802032 RepID=A0A1F7GL87_9BACT|nr:MAG: hypothetical protein A2799_00655 [Candidatus Roizmanbacteria bacterium RIFCSPHIGHO2_01_FULL_39_24]OGK27942.1 MAG: hypothetical protein A3D80_03925 [Candidatus Roizmanbacteria bacterium RIFCSPHIGHO2_02_FULL_40_13b]OGK50073.1 MAG: hypothetical protein A3A56_02160 [Candidatus Roizmanbacteria bacterium RIFCSPLOWO2_01_FULL_40_32]OGK56375.1 MAG: hypothetical protein A3H83_02610 [Candidatus Roizmanbacteria bacterium RIFCSPLOWO2_02_FULL_39_8]